VGIVISGNLTFSSRMRSAAKIAKSVGLSLHSYGRPLSTSTSFLAVIRGRSTRIRVLREFSFGNLHIFPVIPLSFRIICSFSRWTDRYAVVKSTNPQYEAPKDGEAPCIGFWCDCFCFWTAARRLYIASCRCRAGRDPCCEGVSVSNFSVKTLSRDSRMPSNSFSIALDKKMPR